MGCKHTHWRVRDEYVFYYGGWYSSSCSLLIFHHHVILLYPSVTCIYIFLLFMQHSATGANVICRCYKNMSDMWAFCCRWLLFLTLILCDCCLHWRSYNLSILHLLVIMFWSHDRPTFASFMIIVIQLFRLLLFPLQMIFVLILLIITLFVDAARDILWLSKRFFILYDSSF